LAKQYYQGRIRLFTRVLVLGEQKLDYMNVCQIPFGAYAQVHDDLSVTNTMESRTTEAVSLGTTGNIQGTHKFLSLKTIEIIVRQKWTELPIPSDAIDRSTDLVANEMEFEEFNKEEEDDVGELSEAPQQVVQTEQNKVAPDVPQRQDIIVNDDTSKENEKMKEKKDKSLEVIILLSGKL